MPEQGGDGDEQLWLSGRISGIDLGTETTPTVAEAPKKKSGVVGIPKKLAETSTAKADLIVDLVHKIESLKKADAIARLFELDGWRTLRL
jgi:hypothetical protein